jgi:hypothetical protein
MNPRSMVELDIKTKYVGENCGLDGAKLSVGVRGEIAFCQPMDD